MVSGAQNIPWRAERDVARCGNSSLAAVCRRVRRATSGDIGVAHIFNMLITSAAVSSLYWRDIFARPRRARADCELRAAA